MNNLKKNKYLISVLSLKNLFLVTFVLFNRGGH